MPTPTYTKINSVTLASPASSFGFSNIPGTYRDIIVKIAARANSGGNGHDVFSFTVNGTQTGLWTKSIYTNGTSNGYVANSGTSSYVGAFPMAGANSNTFGNSEWIFGRYSSGLYATLLVDSASENNASNAQNVLGGMLWENGDPITSLNWYSYSGYNFAAGTTAHLYGTTY